MKIDVIISWLQKFSTACRNNHKYNLKYYCKEKTYSSQRLKFKMLHDTYTADMFTTTAKEQILACCIATLFLTKMENKYHKYAFHK